MNNKTFLPFVALCLIWGSTWYFITVSVVDYNMPPIYAVGTVSYTHLTLPTILLV